MDGRLEPRFSDYRSGILPCKIRKKYFFSYFLSEAPAITQLYGFEGSKNRFTGNCS